MTLVKKFHRYTDDSAGPTAPMVARNAAIGTGAAWVTLLTITNPEWLAASDTLLCRYTVVGTYSGDRVLSQGYFALTELVGEPYVTAGSLDFTSARVQVVVDGSNNVAIQVQQHATENWSFWGKVEFELVN